MNAGTKRFYPRIIATRNQTNERILENTEVRRGDDYVVILQAGAPTAWTLRSGNYSLCQTEFVWRRVGRMRQRQDLFVRTGAGQFPIIRNLDRKTPVNRQVKAVGLALGGHANCFRYLAAGKLF